MKTVISVYTTIILIIITITIMSIFTVSQKPIDDGIEVEKIPNSLCLHCLNGDSFEYTNNKEKRIFECSGGSILIEYSEKDKIWILKAIYERSENCEQDNPDKP